MNKISFFIFLALSLLFVVNGFYQGITHGHWTTLVLSFIVIALGSYSIYKKSQK